MADSTIANLTDGATADATDRIPVERSPFGIGTNRYVTPAYIRTLVGTFPRVVVGATSGAIPYFDSPTSEASSGLLAADQVMIGGGAGAAPSTLAAGTDTHVLTMVAGAPAWAAAAGGAAALSGITAAAGANTIASGNNHSQIWNWALTSNSVSAFNFGETTAATGGTSTSGVPNQVIGKFSTLAASTASPLSVYSRGAHVFSVSPTTAQILAADGSNAAPSYSFAGATGTGLAINGTTLKLISNGALCADASATQFRIPKGSAATPSITENVSWANAGLFWPASGILAVTGSGREMVRWTPASAGGGWQIMDEADSNPTTTELDASDSVAIYNKADKLVFAYNLGGVMNYLTIPLDGSTTTWTNSTAAP